MKCEYILNDDIYDKYERFKENIEVNQDKNSKWCPRPNCNNAVRRKNRFTNQAICECGYEFCFKC